MLAINVWAHVEKWLLIIVDIIKRVKMNKRFVQINVLQIPGFMIKIKTKIFVVNVGKNNMLLMIQINVLI